jgi:type I restriction enzyme S subunit
MKVPLRAVYRRRDETGRPDLELLSVYRDLGVVRREGRDDNFNKPGDDLAAYRVVRPSDLVLNKMKTWQGSLGVSQYLGIVSPAYFVAEKIADADDRYLHHLLRSGPMIAEYASRSKGIRPNQWDLPWEEFASIHVTLPDASSQRAIADHLDAELSAMEDLLAKKRRLVDLLQEQIDSAIMELVGQSAIVQGGHVLRALPVRRQLARLDRPPVPDTQVITAFRDGQVTARVLRRTEGFTESWTAGARVQGVLRGDVVVHGLDGFAGAIGTSEADGVCSPVYHVCSPTEGGDTHFYGRMLRVLGTTGYLGNFATSTRERAVDFRNWDLFGRIPIPVVEVAEQCRIGDRIRRLAPIRERLDRSELLINERKHALITAAVTGQIEIPGVAA